MEKLSRREAILRVILSAEPVSRWPSARSSSGSRRRRSGPAPAVTFIRSNVGSQQYPPVDQITVANIDGPPAADHETGITYVTSQKGCSSRKIVPGHERDAQIPQPTGTTISDYAVG